MEERIQRGLVAATQVASETAARTALNGVYFAAFGETSLDDADLVRMVQAVPTLIAAALASKTYYFVPLAMAEGRNGADGRNGAEGSVGESTAHRTGKEETLISPVYTTELADLSICHRNVALAAGIGVGAGKGIDATVPTDDQPRDGVFISARLLSDRFSLAFEFFINVGHALVDEAGVPEAFSELAWKQALADVRGETSLDAWESRAQALAQSSPRDAKPRIDEKARTEYVEAAFSDAIAIYLLSLAVDFDYSELREREYPLLAPQALAERLRLVARLFPPNPDYQFAIRYRRRA